MEEFPGTGESSAGIFGTSDQFERTVELLWPDIPETDGLFYFILLRRLRAHEEEGKGSSADAAPTVIRPSDFATIVEALLEDCRCGVDRFSQSPMPARLKTSHSDLPPLSPSATLAG
jgi:hypothetical protein